MRSQWLLPVAAVLLVPTIAAAQAPRLNPMIDLLTQNKPVFGLYAPRNARNAETMKTPAQLAADALAYPHADFLFDGTMESTTNFTRTLPAFGEFAQGMVQHGGVKDGRLRLPLVVKMHKITDPAVATEHIAHQLNAGASGVVLVGVESADEVKTAVNAMRFASNGGKRADDVGNAPGLWGLNAQQYRARADLWPQNPRGELMTWAIVESREGLAKVREIAAVPGLGVLFPGSGTLRGVFTSTVNGQRVVDEAGWEGAIQQVLAACKEFKVACGIPATENDVEKRIQQGFRVFIINWGDAGFRTVELGRKAAGR
jgi:2-keto-3-deoxy-L-rhamnonate aldolase RhmA